MIYPKELNEYISEYNYIPKRIKYITELKQFAKYYCIEQRLAFKIEEVIEVSKQIYYQIRILDNNRQAVIPYEEHYTYYELLTDKTDIKSIDNMINSNIPYYGSEIKYWFFIRNIDLRSKLYQGFIQLLTDPRQIISDRKIYYVKADYLDDKDIYINCRAELYRQ